MARMKGQVFMMATLVFSMLVMVMFLSTGPTILNDPLPDTQRFFGQTIQETGDAFDTALVENRSPDNVESRMYRYERFVHLQAQEMGLEYRSYVLIVVPGEGEAVFINYSPDSKNASIAVNGAWHNTSLDAWQSTSTSFKPGGVHVDLETSGSSRDFYASKPRFLKRASMSNQEEIWINTVLG